MNNFGTRQRFLHQTKSYEFNFNFLADLSAV